MTLEEFEKLAAMAVRRLPEAFRGKMENVVLIAAEAPTAAQARRFGPGLQGLYEGIPLTERASYYSGAMPDKITLFKANIEKGRSGRKEIAAAVRHVVMHEIAHHFGITDEELLRKGLY